MYVCPIANKKKRQIFNSNPKAILLDQKRRLLKAYLLYFFQVRRHNLIKRKIKYQVEVEITTYFARSLQDNRIYLNVEVLTPAVSHLLTWQIKKMTIISNN